jgi:predicted Zn finger-like uncharacterized protein
MVVTCASCLTKFNLDDAKIPPHGVKVRCSRCKNVFYVVHPPETREEIIENFESFARYHEELMNPAEEQEVPPAGEKPPVPPPPESEEDAFPFIHPPVTEKPEHDEKDYPPPPESARERTRKEEEKPVKTRRIAGGQRRGPSLMLALLVILVLLVLAAFYVFTQFGAGGFFTPYLETPVKKATEAWHRIWGTETEGLVITELNRYDEKAGDALLTVIQGKVDNKSRSTKKQITVHVVIFDQDGTRIADKEAVCGRTLGRTELKTLPSAFFKGEMVIKPETEAERTVPSGRAAPFVVIFRDLSSRAKEFKVEIVAAPNQ